MITKRDYKKNWSAPWQTSLPIDNLFFCLNTCFFVAMVSKPPYMQPQMAEMAYTVIQETGLFMTACLDCNITGGNMWINLKDHSTKTYDTLLVTSTGSNAQHGYTRTMLSPGLPMSGPPADSSSLNTI